MVEWVKPGKKKGEICTKLTWAGIIIFESKLTGSTQVTLTKLTNGTVRSKGNG